MDGFTQLASATMSTADILKREIAAIPDLRILGDPAMSVFAFTADNTDIYAISALMAKKGWMIEAQQLPPSLHMTVTPAHHGRAEEFLRDLRECVATAKQGGSAPEGLGAIYGALAQIPPEMRGGPLSDMVAQYMQELTDTEKIPG